MTYKTDFYQLGDRVLIRDSRSNDTGGSENCGCGCDGSSGSCGCGCGCASRPEPCCSGPTGPTAPSIYAQQGKCRNHAAFSTLKTIKQPL